MSNPDIMKHKKAKIRIQRFNPEIDKKPYMESFSIDIGPETTILDALEYIKSYVDGSLTFRRSCRHAICGSCAMNINGKNGLACNRPIVNDLDRWGMITIKPLPYMPVIKDLVVDRTRFWEQYLRVKPWLIPPADVDEKEYRMSPAEVDALLDAEKCIMCGACFSACPIVALNKHYIGPHALQKLYMRAVDPRDAGFRERLDEAEQHDGIYGCRTAATCIDECPKGLNPTRTISTLRLLAQRRAQFEAERAQRLDSITLPVLAT